MDELEIDRAERNSHDARRARQAIAEEQSRQALTKLEWEAAEKQREAARDQMLMEFVAQVARVADALESSAAAHLTSAEVALRSLELAERRVEIQEQLAGSSKALEDKLITRITPRGRKNPRGAK